MFTLSTHEDTFIGFFDLNACSQLSFDAVYDIKIVHVEIVGKTVHLLIEVWLDNEKQGLITEAYDATGKEFYNLVKIFYQTEHGRIVAVSTVDLTGIGGFAKLTKRNDQVAVDWSTLEPYQLTCGELANYYRKKN